MSLGLDVRERELDLAVNATGTNERWIEGLNPVSGHDNLDISSRVETVELV